jgi:hypothetical protein
MSNFQDDGDRFACIDLPPSPNAPSKVESVQPVNIDELCEKVEEQYNDPNKNILSADDLQLVISSLRDSKNSDLIIYITRLPLTILTPENYILLISYCYGHPSRISPDSNNLLYLALLDMSSNRRHTDADIALYINALRNRPDLIASIKATLNLNQMNVLSSNFSSSYSSLQAIFDIQV